MELLEREAALADLAAAHGSAAAGRGRVAVVEGEAGIGKTALVTRFTQDLAAPARVLWGTCDDLSIPRPLGPFHDLADISEELAHALAAGAPAHRLQALLIAELARPPGPAVLVLEDVHWADDATLDAVTVIGRRVGELPALLVLTLREGETPAGGRLETALGEIRDALFVRLPPLSREAVAGLAGARSDKVYAATGGNPFYVTELLAAGSPDALPPSVANAVLARAARLDDRARRLVELVSVVPSRVDAAVLDVVLPDWEAAAEEPERRRLLAISPGEARFRHELARNALRSSVPVARRRRLHAEIAQALVALGRDPAEIVHHAELAGDVDLVAAHALDAARRAAALQSNREAFSHFRRATDFADRHPLAERASLYESLAQTAYTVARLDDAFDAARQAIALFRQAGDELAVARCTQMLSRFHWYAGDGTAAREEALAATRILEPLGDSAELARAYSGLSQLAMLADDEAETLEWGERALRLATRLGDEATRAHALTNLGVARLQADPEDPGELLLEAHAAADAAGDAHEATRALLNLAYSLMTWVRPREARLRAEQALAYAEEHEVDTLASYVAATLAWLRLRAGEWDAAERDVRRVLQGGASVAQLLAKTVLAELAVRRGDADAESRLADLAGQADRTGELQRIEPVLALQVEWALTRGSAMPTERLAAILELVRSEESGGWHARLVASWAAVAGLDAAVDAPLPAPHAAMLRRDWRGAADGFGAAGWPYERALMLSLLDEEAALAEALESARGLGAAPLVRRVGRSMRRLGLPVPRGPRAATRANPLGLTARQLEVLALLADGLTNADIADRLVVSPRTAEHHVSAVLVKLGVESRREVARRAEELGLLSRR